mmetsp:Transcript_63990/g.142333  ORF Transcript_63990/g.142333 Transcript_63990/m.142333 type:complete len:271 (+) Transcript_63990:1-813(+)
MKEKKLRAAPEPQLYPGRRVRMRGLQVNQEINDQLGTIVAWDKVEERWKVRLDDGNGKLLHTQHVTPCGADGGDGPALAIGTRVRLIGLRSNAELNGQFGTVQAWDPADERWKVLLASGAAKVFRPANLKIVQGDEEVADAPQTLESLPALPATEVPNAHAAADTLAREPATSEVPARPLALARAVETQREVRAEPPAASQLPLNAGSRIVVNNLESLERDGKLGTALEFVEQIDRWKVVLDDGTSVLIGSSNLCVLNCGWNSKAAQMWG